MMHVMVIFCSNVLAFCSVLQQLVDSYLTSVQMSSKAHLSCYGRQNSAFVSPRFCSYLIFRPFVMIFVNENLCTPGAIFGMGKVCLIVENIDVDCG